jgi:TonB family protein
MRTRILATLIVAALACPAVAQEPDGRDNPLAAARDLYASARYDEALAVLNGMRPVDGIAPDRKSIEQYRLLCLLALGRGTEAELAIAAVVTADPSFQPSEADASPRVRAAFSDVRQRVLPEIAGSRYAAAKATFDRKEYAPAERQFRDLLTLLDDPQMRGRLSDLRVLTSGFLDLSTAAATPPPEPKKEEPPPPPPPAPAAPRPNHIYIAEDPDVVMPVSVKQDVPRVQSAVAGLARDRGMLEIVIDEQGRVGSITIRVSVHPLYDPLLMAAARDWRYTPATVNGVPVKFRKLIQIVMNRK